MKKFIFLIILVITGSTAYPQRISIRANNEPAAQVFRNIMNQTGLNFVYSSDLLRNMKVTVDVYNQSLNNVLDIIFRDTDIIYQIKGNNVILKKEKEKKKKKSAHKEKTRVKPQIVIPDTIVPTVLNELIVLSRPEPSSVETAEIGFNRITAEEIRKTPALLGENDIIRTLHTKAGVVEGTEGIAGMNVDGGNPDENLYILDNIPIYQANHFGGLFSAFNTDIISQADFYKTSIPSKFDGRLSSFMDIKLKTPNREGHHGSARIGLTSGAFNISGPLGSKTTYIAGIRRSWYDVLTIPFFAIYNSLKYQGDYYEEKNNFHYYFTDLNAKLIHNFSKKLSGNIGLYYGNDLLNSHSYHTFNYYNGWDEDSRINLNWGNLMIKSELNYQINPKVSSAFIIAYNRFFSNVKNSLMQVEKTSIGEIFYYDSKVKSENNINDFIIKSDFSWNPQDNIHGYMGAGYTLHSFLPNRISRKLNYNESTSILRDSTRRYMANEAMLYLDFDWEINNKFRLDAGINTSCFNIEKKTHLNLSPRFSFSYRISQNVAIKTAYSHTVQYIHQLSRSYLSLPVDQWVPVTGNFNPETADKIAIGAYWSSNNKNFEISLEGYYKKMYNLLDDKDEYYLLPPLDMWTGQLTSGSGTAKGISITFEKKTGRITGELSYTLAWSNRLFPDKNNGKRFPSRYDNRHTINLMLNWEINDKVSLNVAWVGHSGNRFTFLPQSYQSPELESINGWEYGVPLKERINNYQLPFYHRLDLSCMVRNKHGYWSFGLYNAYCNMNTIAIVRDYDSLRFPENNNYSKPVFKKLKLFPTIPSISYTWEF